ncbi:retrovirus-related pol polyprotein from transposon TNT 1-94 [Tanacetum coccineum]
MNDHSTSFNQLVTDLMNMDEVFKDQDLALILLGLLSYEYELLETTLLNGKDDVSLSEVCDALYSKELRRKDNHISSSRDAEVLLVRGRSQKKAIDKRWRSKLRQRLSKDECACCHEKGQWKRDCPRLKTKDNHYKGKAVAEANVTKSDNKESDLSLATSSSRNAFEILSLDFTCSHHITPHRECGKMTRVKFGTSIHKTQVWVYTLKIKDEVLGVYLKWKKMMEIQTWRKIKYLRTYNDGEYKNDLFIKFCEDEGIIRHYTVKHIPQQNGVVERMNRTLLNKVQCMLFDAGLGKEFWAEAVTYVCHLESKLDLREKKALCMGITPEVKGYHLWCPETKNTIFSRNVTFDESAMLKRRNDNDSPMVEGDYEEEEVQTEEPRQQQHESIATSKPKRNTKRPALLNDTVACASSIAADDVPTTYSEAVRDSEHEKCKLVYAKKEGFPSPDDVCYKARLVAKGYSQKEGIDYNEVFSPVVKHSSIRILLALVAHYDLELVQIDVNTTFLSGDLKRKSIWFIQKDSKLFDKLTHRVSTPLASQFKISDAMSPKNDTERAYIEKVPYGNVIGSLQCVMICTRPYISYVVGMVSMYMHNPGKGHWQAIKWIFWYTHNTVDVGLVFKHGSSQWVVGYCDSDYAGDLDKQRSTTGYVFTLAKAPISWKSNL